MTLIKDSQADLILEETIAIRIGTIAMESCGWGETLDSTLNTAWGCRDL
jgi:hypothetical protein